MGSLKTRIKEDMKKYEEIGLYIVGKKSISIKGYLETKDEYYKDYSEDEINKSLIDAVVENLSKERGITREDGYGSGIDGRLYYSPNELKGYEKAERDQTEEEKSYKERYGNPLSIELIPTNSGGILKNGGIEFYKVNYNGQNYILQGGKLYSMEGYKKYWEHAYIVRLRGLTIKEVVKLQGILKGLEDKGVDDIRELR